MFFGCVGLGCTRLICVTWDRCLRTETVPRTSCPVLIYTLPAAPRPATEIILLTRGWIILSLLYRALYRWPYYQGARSSCIYCTDLPIPSTDQYATEVTPARLPLVWWYLVHIYCLVMSRDLIPDTRASVWRSAGPGPIYALLPRPYRTATKDLVWEINT